MSAGGGPDLLVGPRGPADEPVSEVKVRGRRLGADRSGETYALVTDDYVRTGGDGYAVLRDEATTPTTSARLEDVVADYLAARPTTMPVHRRADRADRIERRRSTRVDPSAPSIRPAT